MSRFWSPLLALPLLIGSCGPRHEPAPTVRERLGDWPFLAPLDSPTTIALREGEGAISSSAASCGSCHQAVYAEWGQSTHAAALGDLQFLAELAKPDSPRWLCLNCHTPTAPQRPYLLTPDTRLASKADILHIEQVPNPDFDPARQQEAITCATCHVRRDSDGQGLVLAPADHGASPHRVRADAAALDGVCVRCHSPGPAKITPTFVCWFQTADELAAGPQAGTGCVDCHMPSTERPVADGQPSRQTRQHHWVGGGVPKSFDGYDTLLSRGWAPGVEVGVALASDPAGTVATVRLHNVAGHDLPTADPERFLRLSVRLVDNVGVVLSEHQERLGQTWDWGDMVTGREANRVADTRLKAGEAREIAVPLPAGGAAVIIEVEHVRLTAENAAYMKQAVVDAELVGYRPTLVEDLGQLESVYPMSSWIYSGRFPLDGATPTVESLEGLVARSRQDGGVGVR